MQDTEFQVISEVKWSQTKFPKKKVRTRDKWYKSYAFPGENYLQWSELESSKTEVHKTETKPVVTKLELNQEVSAIDAIRNDQIQGFDIRPKVFDSISKQWVLLDSGSCVSCHPAGPDDVVDPSFKLKSVNGGIIDTYGTKLMTLRIGRKAYSIHAVIAAVPQPIFGWDIFKKYSLSLEWNQWGDLVITDKKANISSPLKYVTVDSNTISRVKSATNSLAAEQSHFEMECMKRIEAISIGENEEAPFFIDNLPLPSNLDPEADKNDRLNAEALSKLEDKYAAVVKQYNILKTTFDKNPSHSIKHVIDTGDANPIKSKVRPLLADSKKSIEGKKIWEEMQRMGVIERVHPSALTQWASPLHLAKKPNSDSFRPCVDFRLVNQVTKADNYPIPTLKAFTKQLKGCKVFSVVDLRSAFFNLPIHENSIDKTTVLSPWGGAFVFKRLPFGLRNGPSSWMKFLDHALSGLDHIYTYLDDILVSTETEQQHMEVLHKLFSRLEKFGLSLALDKCTFGKEEVNYLGYKVTSKGISPLKSKVEAVTKIPPPTNQKELLGFLGALNYFRSSLSGLKKDGKYHNAANLLQPLYSAATTVLPTKKHFQQVWDNSPILKSAFQDAKQLLINATELAHMDPNLPLALFTDSSDHSIGGVLMQQQGHKYVPLGYFSRHLPTDKANWAVYRKELLAAQASLRYFISDIYGKHCTIWTDHLPLVNAYNGSGFQLHDPVAQRALMEISQFTRDIKHISGVDNVAGDYFSRLPPPNDKRGSVYTNPAQRFEVAPIEGHKLEAVSPRVVNELQAECQEVEEIKNGKHPPNTNFQNVKFGEVELFCEVSGAQPRPYLPQPLRLFVMKQLHFDHKGQKEAVRRMSSNYYWKTINNDTVNFIKTCHGCQSTKPSKLKPPHIGEFEAPDQRFSHCHLDIVGPLPPSKGYKYILTIKDRHTRFLQGIPLVSPTSEAIAEAFMLHWAALFGIPSLCTSDQGPNLTSGLFRGLQESLGIKVHYSPIYFPQANGMVERSHQTLKNSIKASLIEMADKYQENWASYLPWALLGLRSSFNKDLGTSPMEMTLGKHVQLPGTILTDPGEATSLEDINVDAILRKLQLKNNRLAVPPSLNRANPKVETLPESVTHVYARQHNIKGLTPSYLGPFPVVSRPSRSTIEIKVGLNKDKSDRLEIRHISDVKVAHLKEDAVIAERPKRGRPPSKPESTPPKEEAVESPESAPDTTVPKYNLRPRRNKVATIDFSVPPPGNRVHNMWTATQADISAINEAINTKYSRI